MVNKKIFFAVALAWALYCVAVFVQAEKIDDLTVSSYVTDYANMIDDDEQSALEQKLSQFAQETSHQILVVTINTLDGDYIEHYSIKLAEKLKAGTSKYDNGAILLIAKDDRQMRIEVWYGLESTITDGVSRQIINTLLIPNFKTNNFSDGIVQASEQMMAVARGEVLPVDDWWSGWWSEETIFLLLYVGFFVLTWLASILGRTKEWRLGGVIWALCGLVLMIVLGWAIVSFLLACGVTLFGLIFDYIVSKDYKRYQAGVSKPIWRTGGTRWPGSSSGSFGWFGGGGFSGWGGSFGGGGASGRW